MPIVGTYPYWPAQKPATEPPPGGEEALSAFEEAADDGTLRPDDIGDTDWQRVPFYPPVLGSDFPFQVPKGTPRPAMHPAGPVGTLHPTDWNEYGGTAGLHGELVQSIQGPAQSGQQPFGANPKTWRAQPQPWDADAYVGWTPGQASADDQLGDV